MWKLIKGLFNKSKDETCNHIFYGEYGPETKDPAGQRCRICYKFNSMEDLGLR